MSVEDGIKPKPPVPGPVDLTTNLGRLIESGRRQSKLSSEDSTQLWAYGGADPRNPIMKWAEVVKKAYQFGGLEYKAGLVFPDAASKLEFDFWYAENASVGLRVRSKVQTDHAAKLVVTCAPSAAPTSTLKDLRMWHWREFLHHRNLQRRYERSTHAHAVPQAQRHRDTANLHLSAVQVLNDSVPGTAERDCAEADHEATLDERVDAGRPENQ